MIPVTQFLKSTPFFVRLAERMLSERIRKGEIGIWHYSCPTKKNTKQDIEWTISVCISNYTPTWECGTGGGGPLELGFSAPAAPPWAVQVTTSLKWKRDAGDRHITAGLARWLPRVVNLRFAMCRGWLNTSRFIASSGAGRFSLWENGRRQGSNRTSSRVHLSGEQRTKIKPGQTMASQYVYASIRRRDTPWNLYRRTPAKPGQLPYLA